MQELVSGLLNGPSWWVYVGVAALVFAEDAFFAGFVIPGETAAVLGGVAASQGHVELPLIYLIVVAAAILGDSTGYEVGKKFGPRLLRTKALMKHEHRLNKARTMLRERGGMAVFLGRWTAFFRAVMPALAGLSHMPYRKFLAWNAVGGIAWGITFVSVGHIAGDSYATLEKTIGRASAVVIAVIIIAALIFFRIRKERIESSEDAES